MGLAGEIVGSELGVGIADLEVQNMAEQLVVSTADLEVA